MKKLWLIFISSLLFAWILEAPADANDLDWSSGKWGIKVTNNGTPGSGTTNVTYPGGTKSGNALEVYYQITEIDVPQFWVFLTDGYWRQASYKAEFLTSYRLFQYYSSQDIRCYASQKEEDRICDKTVATDFHVIGLNDKNQLIIELDYENNALAGDRFQIHTSVSLIPPNRMFARMEAIITVTNVSGYDVTPAWEDHRTLAEQWELFGISSMFVADNLTDEFPLWYDELDPEHNYVGDLTNDDYLDDGKSVNQEGEKVSTHDVKMIVAAAQRVRLDHDEVKCPWIIVPGYEWYEELVMLDQVSSSIKTQHLYDPDRNHIVKLLSSAGLTNSIQDLKWAVTYDRDDENMVDGDNIKVKLGMDDFLNTWPKDTSQTIQISLKTGRGGTALPGWLINLLLN